MPAILGSFDTCLKLVLANEGGWSIDPADPGGATMKGVTQAVYDAYRAHMGQSSRSVRLISDAEISDIYQMQFYRPICGNQLPRGVNFAVFDFAVNSGVARAAQSLQKIVGVKADGIVGLVTLSAVAAHPAADLINLLCDLRQLYLEGLPGFGHFGKGWTARVVRVRADALAMVV